MPSEIIINSDVLKLTQVTDFVKSRLQSSCDLLEDECFDLSKASATVLRHFNIKTLSELSLENALAAVSALAASLDYLKSVQKTELENIKSMTDKTVLIVTHRPAALDICDKIIRFTDNGIEEENE